MARLPPDIAAHNDARMSSSEVLNMHWYALVVSTDLARCDIACKHTV